jgi:hypothetical protein
MRNIWRGLGRTRRGRKQIRDKMRRGKDLLRAKDYVYKVILLHRLDLSTDHL